MAKITLTAIKVTVESSLSQTWAKATPGDNAYVTGGVQLNLSPGSILDPKALGVIGPSQVPFTPPGVFNESMGGYYAQVIPATGVGSAGLSTFKLQYFQPGGAELAAGAYPNAILNGNLTLQIVY